MADQPPPQIQKVFRIGRVLGLGFVVIRSNLASFAILMLGLSSLWPAFRLGTSSWIGGSILALGLGGLSVWLLSVLLSVWAAAGLVHGAIEALNQRPVMPRDMLGRGLARIFPVIGIALIHLFIFVLCVAFAAVFIALPVLNLMFPILLFGSFVAVITVFWIAIPIAVVDGAGVFDGLSRSIVMTKGNRWRVCGLVLIMLVLHALVAIAESFALSAVGLGSLTVTALASWVTTAAVYAMYAVMSAVSFHELRLANEGGGVEQVAAIFD